MFMSKDVQIIELLEEHTIASVKDLSTQVGCTEMTIRRYLDSLEERGLIVRAHGCAYLTPDAKPTVFEEQMNLNSREKFLIAHAAVKMIKENDIVCFDSGTTIHRMVNLLDRNTKFTAITPSLPFATELAKTNNVEIIMHEGTLNKKNLTLEYSESTQAKNFKADISFISCRAFNVPTGTFEHTDSLISTKQWLAKVSKKKVLLVDSSKWQKSSVQLCIPLKNIDVVITDSRAPQKSILTIEKLGKKVILVDDSVK